MSLASELAELRSEMAEVRATRERRGPIVAALIGVAATVFLAIVGAAVAYGELRESANQNAAALSEIRGELRDIRSVLINQSGSAQSISSGHPPRFPADSPIPFSPETSCNRNSCPL